MAQVRTNSASTTQKGSEGGEGGSAAAETTTRRRKRRGDDGRSNCAIEATLSVIGGRWKAVVLFWLSTGTHRFGQLRRRLPNCTERMLTLQLRELEEDGLVKRTAFPEVPPRVEYELTAFGRSLEPVLIGMGEWGKRYKRRLS